MMKGKKEFTREEANQIESLIEEKLKSDATKQKSIRSKIRRIGFYASDFDNVKPGYDVEDFRKNVTIKD